MDGGLLALRRPTPAPKRMHRRFDRLGRLVGDAGIRALDQAHVMVIGLGGVGSWAAESLARSGVGRLTIVDFDLVCVTNQNRQLHALKGTIGRPKAEVMRERLALIHPTCALEAVTAFYHAPTSDELLGRAPDLIVDAIDNLTAKAHLIASATARGIALVVSGGASGRLDPTEIRCADLTEVKDDAFLASLRKILRRKHGFARSGAWGIPTIHSREPLRAPKALAYDGADGFRCVCPQGDNGLHGCEHRNVILGTASFVTGAFGLACASQAVRLLLARAEPDATGEPSTARPEADG